MHLSVQLYCVRASLESDFDATLARLAEIGFRQVEPFGLVQAADRLAELLPKHGLTAPTAHVGLLTDDPAAAFEAAKRIGVTTIIEPHVDRARWQTADDVRVIAAQLNEVAAQAKDHGLTVGYHNHHFELESRIDGRHALEVFADQLAPEVVLEVDTYWASVGGADVPALLQRLGDKVVALHIKDGDGTLNTKSQQPAGAGVIPVKEFLAASPDSLAVVEYDDYDGDIFEGVAASYAFLRGLA